MSWCCGNIKNVESPSSSSLSPSLSSSPVQEKLSVSVPVAAKPITLMFRAPPVDQHIVVLPVKKEELAASVEETPTVVKSSSEYNKAVVGTAVVVIMATAAYCLSNPNEMATILTPVRNIYADFM